MGRRTEHAFCELCNGFSGVVIKCGAQSWAQWWGSDWRGDKRDHDGTRARFLVWPARVMTPSVVPYRTGFAFIPSCILILQTLVLNLNAGGQFPCDLQ